ncbi:dTDP-3,4-didehydro-2,6-dideoxy-alpha-D-glucose 3-reductase [Arenibacter antarcticus]|uniref:Gfo/Idh/MocA family protein n=1 Tax=Arenibacter antarcticus TaxID=2040469 RepID=A0ABW5VCP4_9FLAO|nr:Gfo/Idh/MocA family oxidoreductase [Arenibacter sp. H213]MCM4167429.1 NAD-binding protein [Arenibacter sp. H213]
MEKKIRWGILGAATIAVEQFIPAIQESNYGELSAIASRNISRAKKIAAYYLGIKSYGDYQELLNDPGIDAVYIPLPNHLHVFWAIKALEAGKHVLVEKPIGTSKKDGELLQKTSQEYPHMKVMEAFMYRFHPQWIKAKELIAENTIGKVGRISSSFSFFDDDPKSIVNNKEFGGGSLRDIGCYSLSLSRYIFESEPIAVSGVLELDAETKVDLSASGILEFKEGISTFFSSIRLADHQKTQLYGTKGSIEFEYPFNPPTDRPSKIWVHKENGTETISCDPCNQYTLQLDAFSLSILSNSAAPTPLQDGINNMLVLEKLEESHEKGRRILL